MSTKVQTPEEFAASGWVCRHCRTVNKFELMRCIICCFRRDQKYALTKCRKSERLQLLERVAKLASELCTAVDRESEDIGGSRPSLTILREIGPLCDKLEGK